MKFNTKILKRILSVTLAVTMTTSCFVGSVGAFRAPEGASQEIVNGINSLNAKVDDYKRRLNDAKKRLSDIRRAPSLRAKGNVSALTFAMISKLGKLDGRSCESMSGLDRLTYAEVYNLDDIKKISDMLDGLEKDIDDLVDWANRIEVDYNTDEVFLRNGVVNVGINLDENQNNEDRIKLPRYKMNREFGQKCKDLNRKLLFVHKFVKSSVARILRKAVISMHGKNSELLKALNKKLGEYEEVRSNFWDMKEILHIKGRHTKELSCAFSNLTDNPWGSSVIGPERKIQMLSSEESVREAVEQVDTAIQEMNKYIAMNIIKLNVNGKEQIIARLNECINKLSDRQNIIVSENGEEKFVKEGFVSSEAFKNINREFTAAYLQLKPLMAVKGAEGNQLMTEFKNLYLELLDLYTFNQELSQNEFEAKMQEKAQNVRNKLNVIVAKI